MITNISQNKVFDGWHKQYSHDSATLNCNMRLAIYLPQSATSANPVPVLYWLSGLTCTDENFMQKAGAFRMASELGIAIVAPDTSPRGDDVADDEGYDLGKGAGFYVNATEAPWSRHYQMYDYVVKELPGIIENNFPVSGKKSIAGHSMGGHGALTVGLKNQQQYCSISAFSPITNPMRCPWGQKAFSAYLGNNTDNWKHYDACELLKASKSTLPILVDQGDADDFLEEQLKPEALIAAAQSQGTEIDSRIQQGYDHSYFFISSFIDDHLRFHAKHLGD
ncbi:MAG: S-formylglutathione hydrolase [Gammaproteobacteria bacterium]|nr:S-formylglutathione hydrolase [Gammaproteobacteria bacterium]NNM11913.1 S-formylglutathione hydrolase [Pseudomonadales bacterium]